jgi:hypothetical protein
MDIPKQLRENVPNQSNGGSVDTTVSAESKFVEVIHGKALATIHLLLLGMAVYKYDLEPNEYS